MNPEYLSVLEGLLSQPTAPFQEGRVAAAVETWARAKGLPFERDSAGNVLLRYCGANLGESTAESAENVELRRDRAHFSFRETEAPHRGADGASASSAGVSPVSRSQWVFAAHMDHPGFTALECKGQDLLAEFRGFVGPSYFVGSRARFFAPAGEAVGVVRSIESVPETPWFRCRIELHDSVSVPRGTLGMWDLPPMELAGQVLSSRACDDVVGVAGVLCAMGEIVARGLAADVTALLTRAEEAGFVGALAACEARSLDADARIVAIETSKAQPAAALGDGVVIRVGDRARTFEPSLTAHLSAVAEELAKRDKDFKHTRQLMPGGVCESTAFVMYGYQATGLCIPLGNYHNQGEGNRIAPEQVHTGDFESLVKLLVGLAANGRTPADTDAAAKLRLENIIKQRAKYLRNPV